MVHSVQHFSPDSLQARHAKCDEHFNRQQISYNTGTYKSCCDRSFAAAGPRVEQFAVSLATGHQLRTIQMTTENISVRDKLTTLHHDCLLICT